MKQSNEHLFVGLTGGIGSGKTTAAKAFYKFGAEVFDADEISRNALSPNGPCVKKTITAFGDAIVLQEGYINRKALSDIIFADENKRKMLNDIIHPYVIHELLRRAYASDRKIVLFDVPLLFECGLDRLMDVNIVVSASTEERIKRVMKRNAMSREEVESRIASQFEMEKHFSEADYRIDNNGSETELLYQVKNIYDAIKDRIG